MSNFTKSIVYSGVVLVAGLVAVFSIYNNMATTSANSVANIEPAAGGYTSTMPDASSIMDDSSDYTDVNTDVEAEDESTTELEEMLSGTEEEQQAEDAAEMAVEDAKDELSNEIASDIDNAVEQARMTNVLTSL